MTRIYHIVIICINKEICIRYEIGDYVYAKINYTKQTQINFSNNKYYCAGYKCLTLKSI